MKVVEKFLENSRKNRISTSIRESRLNVYSRVFKMLISRLLRKLGFKNFEKLRKSFSSNLKFSNIQRFLKKTTQLIISLQLHFHITH